MFTFNFNHVFIFFKSVYTKHRILLFRTLKHILKSHFNFYGIYSSVKMAFTFRLREMILLVC